MLVDDNSLLLVAICTYKEDCVLDSAIATRILGLFGNMDSKHLVTFVKQMVMRRAEQFSK